MERHRFRILNQIDKSVAETNIRDIAAAVANMKSVLANEMMPACNPYVRKNAPITKTTIGNDYGTPMRLYGNLLFTSYLFSLQYSRLLFRILF